MLGQAEKCCGKLLVLIASTSSNGPLKRACGIHASLHVQIQRGDRGSASPPPPPPPPGKLQKNIGFLSNTGPNPLKITKLPIQHSMLGHHRPASETPFKWCFTGRPVDGTLIVVFGSSILIKLKKNPKKHQSWTPSDKTC